MGFLTLRNKSNICLAEATTPYISSTAQASMFLVWLENCTPTATTGLPRCQAAW